MTIDPRHEVWRKEFEEMGEESVRMIPSSMRLPDDRDRFVAVWLKQQEELREEARQAEFLAAAKEANRIADAAASAANLSATSAASQARWAKWSAITAIIAAIIAAIAAAATIITAK
jgi:hypothetical protein